MKFQESITTCLTKIVNFNGRATRSEYWWFVLFIFAVVFFLGILAGMVGMSSGTSVISIVAILSLLAVGTRRLHDTNRSGWLQLIGLIPVLGWLVMLYFFVQVGTEPNRFREYPQ